MNRNICSHSRGRWHQPAGYDYEGEPFEPEWVSQSTYEDISIGAFRCTQCGEVGYYTGLWRDYYEKGIPCPGSENLKKYPMPDTPTPETLAESMYLRDTGALGWNALREEWCDLPNSIRAQWRAVAATTPPTKDKT